MEHNARPVHPLTNTGLVLAPVDGTLNGAPLRLCVLVRLQTDAAAGPFVLLRELPGARVYLGSVCDQEGRIQEWVEIWVQTVDLRDLTYSSYQERLTNHVFDQRWRAECEQAAAHAPETVLMTGMETKNPRPILIHRPAGPEPGLFATVEPSPWQLCTEDALLEKFGLPPYSTSPFRYLHNPGAGEPKTFLAVSEDAPANAHVQGIEALKKTSGEIFNPHAGLLRVCRFSPLGFEEYLQILEGRPWEAAAPAAGRLFQRGVYGELQTWSAAPRGMPFLLHGAGEPGERLNEIFFLKLSALLGLFKEVRSYVKACQLPMLNLSPASFTVRLPETGEQFPAFWPAQCLLAKPGQAHLLRIKSTQQKYFIRLGKIEPSPFLPEGLGAHSFGIGSVRRRNVLSETDGVVLEGTLVAEDYLKLDPHDLLWFKLPIGEERIEFYAHVHTAEAVGPKEARFRTVPAKLSEAVAGVLKNTAGFAKAPYEIWPLLSSPCDMHSLGIIAIRALLANSQSQLPIIVDDVLGLARRLGKDPVPEEQLPARLRSVLQSDPKLFDLVSPQAMVERDWTPEQARSHIRLDLWLDAVGWLLRLFPGAGSQSYCKNFGDVAPHALESVFDRPIQELESLVLRLRSLLAPSTAANEEIAAVILDLLPSA